ncbi:MAG: multicopper oxidase family protein [Hydrogenibacillus sp.]|nr:multicopper oxidase family protein [Hydrogenibacillus sp.]
MNNGEEGITRRSFLKAAGAVVLAGAVGYPLMRLWTGAVRTDEAPFALPSQAPWIPWNGRERAYRLVVTRERVAIDGGPEFEGYLINGAFPGPELRAVEGDRLRVSVVNRTEGPLTIHWHGVHTPTSMDGVPILSQEPIAPGETFDYTFIASPSGTRWYHAHIDELEQIPSGLFGPLIIEPAEQSLSSASTKGARDVVLMLSTRASSRPRTGGMGGMMGTEGMMGRMMGRGGRAEAGLVYLVNGRMPGTLSPIRQRGGERLVLRLINASATEPFWLEAEGAVFRVTHVDGNPLSAARFVRDVYIAPAERLDAELIADRPGALEIRSRLQGQETLRIPFVVEATAEESRLPDEASPIPWSYAALGGGAGPSLAPADVTLPMVLSGGMMSPDWTINGEVYPRISPAAIEEGQHVRLELFNHSMAEHPMHLHGHSFWVTSVGGVPLRAPLLKDTVNVRPMERMTIDFVANNPGHWLFHCHQLEHMAAGMATVVTYRGLPLPNIVDHTASG